MNKRLTISSLLLTVLACSLPMNAGTARKSVTKNKYAGYLFAYFEGSGDKQNIFALLSVRMPKTGMRSTITSQSSPVILSVPAAVSETLISSVVKMAAIISWLPI